MRSALLDSPRLRRVFIVTDVIGGDTPDRVEDLVQKTPRTEARYGRITVSQGIVIDPLHPQKATVFALVLNEQELRNFQKKLEQSFPQRVEDAEADPIVVGQLAEVGHLAVLQGTPASEVFIPRDVLPRIAFRSDPTRQQPAGDNPARVRLSDFPTWPLPPDLAASQRARSARERLACANPAAPVPDELAAAGDVADVRTSSSGCRRRAALRELRQTRASRPTCPARCRSRSGPSTSTSRPRLSSSGSRRPEPGPGISGRRASSGSDRAARGRGRREACCDRGRGN